LLRGNTVKCL